MKHSSLDAAGASSNPSVVNLVDLTSVRAVKARAGAAIGKTGLNMLITIAVLCGVAAVIAGVTKQWHVMWFAAAAATALLSVALWVKGDLFGIKTNPADGLNGRLSADALALLPKNSNQTPLDLWNAYKQHWQTNFIMNHFYAPDAIMETSLADSSVTTANVYENAVLLADASQSDTVEIGHIIGGAMLSAPSLIHAFAANKLGPDDIRAVVAWLDRGRTMIHRKSEDYGGIGRDWAHGYTPALDRFGTNVSARLERGGNHYAWLSESPAVKGMKNAFAQGASAIALIGDSGSGKTSHVYALAQNLLAEKQDRNLQHHQVVSLQASAIISSASRPGELEYIMNVLMNESASAGHIVLFFDDAELFFTNAAGAFDISNMLLPVLQSRAVRMIFAFTPHSWQTLKASNTSLASLIAPVVLAEMNQNDTMRVLEDTTLGFESRRKMLITYAALKEAYRLSGRYETEVAYPGRAINLLEQSLAQAENNVVNEIAVQKAIEQSRGVKVTNASAAESDTLLNLEQKIHERMINQTKAVSVVSNALRRARAGVANPKRPIGSFLFLGPTGVGKTELAKAISAVYFGTEANMIRLDMSEYQQAEDVARLLSDGTSETNSLILSVRQQPFGVVLLDEIEKAHPNILNLLLQLLDEGQLTDTGGRMASFKDCVIICTSNAGADTIRERVLSGAELSESFETELTDQLIGSGTFKPELLNRYDEIVLFRPLNQDELLQIVALMMNEVNATLTAQNISVELTEAAARRIVAVGYDPRLGARPMRRTLQRAVEDVMAQKILKGEAAPGSHTVLDTPDLAL